MSVFISLVIIARSATIKCVTFVTGPLVGYNISGKPVGCCIYSVALCQTVIALPDVSKPRNCIQCIFPSLSIYFSLFVGLQHKHHECSTREAPK
jgi:hypothetical protein